VLWAWAGPDAAEKKPKAALVRFLAAHAFLDEFSNKRVWAILWFVDDRVELGISYTPSRSHISCSPVAPTWSHIFFVFVLFFS
jgi:hypothetical protein